MASIINLERNLIFRICLKNNSMLDYEPQRSDYENWIPFVLYLILPNKHSVIDEDSKATMTMFELKDFIHGLENILVHLNNRENYIYKFNNSEGIFEINLEAIPQDNVVEIEIWINIGIQTKGRIYGFDEGVRFVLSKEELSSFLVDFKKEFKDLCIFKE